MPGETDPPTPSGVSAPTPPGGIITRDYLIDLTEYFLSYSRDLTLRDGVGCAIAHRSIRLIPRGKKLSESGPIASLAIREFGDLAPGLLIDAGFIPKSPSDVSVTIPEGMLGEGFRVWATVFDSRKSPKDAREKILKALWCVVIVPRAITRDEETEALREGARISGLAMEGEDALTELWLDPPPEILYCRKGGSYKLDSKAIKDVLRKRCKRYKPVGDLSLNVPGEGGEDAASLAEVPPARGVTEPREEARDPAEVVAAGEETEKLERERVAFNEACRIEKNREALDVIREWIEVRDCETLAALAARRGLPPARVWRCWERIKRRARRALA